MINNVKTKSFGFFFSISLLSVLLIKRTCTRETLYWFFYLGKQRKILLKRTWGQRFTHVFMIYVSPHKMFFPFRISSVNVQIWSANKTRVWNLKLCKFIISWKLTKAPQNFCKMSFLHKINEHCTKNEVFLSAFLGFFKIFLVFLVSVFLYHHRKE